MRCAGAPVEAAASAAAAAAGCWWTSGASIVARRSAWSMLGMCGRGGGGGSGRAGVSQDATGLKGVTKKGGARFFNLALTFFFFFLNLSVLVRRPSPPLWRHPHNIPRRILDVAGLAVQAILRGDAK